MSVPVPASIYSKKHNDRPVRIRVTRRAAAGLVGIILALASIVAGAGDVKSQTQGPQPVRVAVAANFTEAMQALTPAFEAKTGHKVLSSFGATGAFYAQISQGAPFDVLLAADAATPAKAIVEGLAVAGSTVTYALGRLVLYSQTPGLVMGTETLTANRFAKLAIANPATAPYGAAAIETLHALGVVDALKPKLVQGAHVAQTLQFVETGNAELGFVALAQIARRNGGSRWLVPAPLHTPIRQDAVLLKQGESNPGARAFLAFLIAPDARAIIRAHGYEIE